MSAHRTQSDAPRPTTPGGQRSQTLEIRTSPHIMSGAQVDWVMQQVLVALLPTVIFAVYAFGLAALLILAVAVASCLATEAAFGAGGRARLRDGSALVTAVLFALTLPPGLPLWMVGVGAVVSIGVGKCLFGGLGANPFNPALVGRAFLQAAFPASMTTWEPVFADGRFGSLPASTLTLPLLRPSYDGVTAATPLAAWKFEGQLGESLELLLGGVSGSLGETSGVFILLGGAYLVARNLMNWRITLSILVSVFAWSVALYWLDPARYAPPAFMLFSGGLLLGAVFMATDMVGSPMTHLGCWIYGSLIGLLVVVIRSFAGMPEGVMYAILLGNATTPLIDSWVRPAVFGTASARGVTGEKR